MSSKTMLPSLQGANFSGYCVPEILLGLPEWATGPNTNSTLSERGLSKLVEEIRIPRSPAALKVMLTQTFHPVLYEFLERNQPRGKPLSGRNEVVQLEPGSKKENSPDELMITGFRS